MTTACVPPARGARAREGRGCGFICAGSCARGFKSGQTAGQNLRGHRRKRLTDVAPDDLRLPDVPLRRAERLVSHGPLDLERVIPAHGPPGDAGRAQVVERQMCPRVIVRKKLRSRHARARKEAPEALREVFGRRHLDEPRATQRPCFLDHHREQRAQVRFDRYAMRDHRLRRFRRTLTAGTTRPDARRGPMDEHYATDEIHVFDAKRRDLTRAKVEVGCDREEPTPPKRDGRARHQGGELARVQPRLRALHAAIRPQHTIRRVVKPNAQRAVLGSLGVPKGSLDDAPDIERRLRPDLAGARCFIEPLHDALDLLVGHVADRSVTDQRGDPFFPAAGRLVGDRDAACTPIGGPAFEPSVGLFPGHGERLARPALVPRER